MNIINLGAFREKKKEQETANWSWAISSFVSDWPQSDVLSVPINQDLDSSVELFENHEHEVAAFFDFNSDESTAPDLMEIYCRDGDEIISFGYCVPWCSPDSDDGWFVGQDENDDLVLIRFYDDLNYSVSTAPDPEAQALGYAKAARVLAEIYRETTEASDED